MTGHNPRLGCPQCRPDGCPCLDAYAAEQATTTPAREIRVDQPTAAFLQSLYGDDWAQVLAAATPTGGQP